MSDLSQFDHKKKTDSSRKDIFFSLKNIMAQGVSSVKGTLGLLVGTPSSGKNQITKDLSRREKRLKRQRSSIKE